MNHTPDPVIGIFNHALRLTPEERAEYLDRLGATGGEMRGRVVELLQAYDRAGDFMMKPAAVLHSSNAGEPPAGEGPGDWVGPYKLLQQIGEGGCGIVFMAGQDSPIRRRVALKLIKPGMDTRSVIARFEAERQALALMDHPGIAKVFDAGVTASGRPYFVMELIRGVKITEFCDQGALSTGERLDLFVQVCQAVQHAHQKGIIHRDLKPSNILVTRTSEATALPVIIDFGVAKAVNSRQLTDKTLFTAYEMLIGTPAYMSPEQAALANVDVDTRSDVYSLGVLLYELLTDHTPFDTGRLLRAGLDEARRVIREQEPVRPSTRLSHMADEELAKVAGHRRENAPCLIRTIHGDLDWIVMRALEKDRARRYQTAHGLGMDVRRYQARDAISARPPSRRYRFQKLVLRNRLLFTCLAAAASLLTVSLAVVCSSLGNERQARREADSALTQAQAGKAAAETEAAKSRQIIRFLEDMLQGVEPAVALGQDTTMLQGILDRTAERVGSELAGQPAVEAELRGVIGRLYSEIGNYEAAGRMFLTELRLRRNLSGPESIQAAAVLHHLGNLFRKQQDLPKGEAAFLEALVIRRRLSTGRDGEADLARTLTGLGAIYCRQRRFVESEAVIREGLEIRTRLFGGEDLEVADSLRNLSILLADVGRQEEAEKAARDMLAIRRRLLGDGHPMVASALMDVAWAAGFTRNSPELEAMETEAFAIRRQVLGDGHPEVAKSIYALGGRMRDRGKLEEAHAVLAAALSIQRNLLGPEHPDVLATLRCLAGTMEKENRWPEAETVWREALESWRKKGGSADASATDALYGLVRALTEQKKYAEAEHCLGEALTPEFVRNPVSAGLLMQRVEILGRQQKWRKAMQDAVLVVGHRPDDPYRYHQLAGLLAVTGELEAYRGLCRKLCAAFAAKAVDPYIAERAAGDCLALPDSGVDLNLMDRLATRAVEAGRNNGGGKDYFEACKALSDYRRGSYSEAAVRADALVGGGDTFARAKAMAVSAMAHWRLGKSDTARTRLAQGNLLAPRPPGGEATDLGNSWLAWLFARLLLDEAEALTTAVSSPTGEAAPSTARLSETIGQ